LLPCLLTSRASRSGHRSCLTRRPPPQAHAWVPDTEACASSTMGSGIDGSSESGTGAYSNGGTPSGAEEVSAGSNSVEELSSAVLGPQWLHRRHEIESSADTDGSSGLCGICVNGILNSSGLGFRCDSSACEAMSGGVSESFTAKLRRY
jgi:hypothetical protein